MIDIIKNLRGSKKMKAVTKCPCCGNTSFDYTPVS